MIPLLMKGMPWEEAKLQAKKSIDEVGMVGKYPNLPSELSGGEQQRVAIARAIAGKPKILFADEPTANLDAANSHHILQTMETLNKELNTTFLFATHDEKVISYLRRKIYLLDGRVDKDEVITK